LTLAVFGLAVWLAQSPNYSAAGLVNGASFNVGPLSPNTIATLKGEGLAWMTKAITEEDLRRGVLPTTLPGTGVRIFIANQPRSCITSRQRRSTW